MAVPEVKRFWRVVISSLSSVLNIQTVQICLHRKQLEHVKQSSALSACSKTGSINVMEGKRTGIVWITGSKNIWWRKQFIPLRQGALAMDINQT